MIQQFVSLLSHTVAPNEDLNNELIHLTFALHAEKVTADEERQDHLLLSHCQS